MHQIHAFRCHAAIRRAAQRGGLRKVACIVVDQMPLLAFWKDRLQGANGRTSAAGKINDRNIGPIAKRFVYGIENVWIGGCPGVWLAQMQPFGRKTIHPTDSRISANFLACSRQDGNLLARAPDASFSRSAGSWIRRRSAQASAGTSSTGIRMPAFSGTVSGTAPAAVPITGSPCAMASASA